LEKKEEYLAAQAKQSGRAAKSCAYRNRMAAAGAESPATKQSANQKHTNSSELADIIPEADGHCELDFSSTAGKPSALELEQVTFEIGGRKLRQAGFHCDRGHAVGLVGPTEAARPPCCRLCVAKSVPDSGEVRAATICGLYILIRTAN